MSKRKNYTTLFLAYCRKHSIWFSVCIDSSIDMITYLKDDNYVDSESDHVYKFGTKAAYDWLQREVKEIEEDLK